MPQILTAIAAGSLRYCQLTVIGFKLGLEWTEWYPRLNEVIRTTVIVKY